MKTTLAALGALSLLSCAALAQDAPTRDVFTDTWIAIDGLGRNIAGSDLGGAPKPNRTVGMFYYIWHNGDSVRDNARILKAFPDIAAQPQSRATWEKHGFLNEGRPRHHWGEPLFGYYRSNDEWVIRKHAQMLSDAGVDTIIFDTSNVDARNGKDLSKHYIQNALTVCRVFSEIRTRGGRAPQFVFLTNGGDKRSASVIQWLYDNLYSRNLYRNAWFTWPDYSDGGKLKPLILGADWEAAPEMQKFFTIRYSWAFDSSKRPKGTEGEGTWQKTWPWTDSYPQHASWGATPQDVQSLSIAVDNGPIYGGLGRSARGERSELSSQNIAYPGVESKYGLYYGEQWDRVWTGKAPWVAPERRFEGVPPFLFLTQWNEWSASRWEAGAHPLSYIPAVPDRFARQTLSAGDSYFVDEFNPEWARDSEPDKSGTSDNYYWQTVDNIRRYKGAREVPLASAPRDFALTDFGAWAQVGPEFRDDVGDTFARVDAPGLGVDLSLDHQNKQSLVYNNRTGRNDFVSAKAALGANGDLTFWASTGAPISGKRDGNWMNLYIRDLTRALPNWSGFSFRIAPGEAGVYKLFSYSGNGENWSWKDTGAIVSNEVRGNQIAVRVAGASLGLAQGVTVDLGFKWTDNVLGTEPDPTDFLVNGDSAPNGRFAYHLRTQSLKQPLISGQIYALQNRATGLVVQLFNTVGSNRAEGTRLRLVPIETAARADAQQWMAQSDGGNIWRFQSFDCGHSLGAATRVQTQKGDDRPRIWRSDEPAIELGWELRPTANGSFHLVHRATGKALTAPKTAKADGADTDNVLRLTDPSDTDAMQEWTFVPQRTYR
ncbi:hypothetical protein IAD21_03964 [Abditibacteriota bacterium]|nr:hypothetical protein IAD21_03964 [Abditibacteriota bacterium]